MCRMIHLGTGQMSAFRNRARFSCSTIWDRSNVVLSAIVLVLVVVLVLDWCVWDKRAAGLTSFSFSDVRAFQFRDEHYNLSAACRRVPAARPTNLNQ
jgi:hypothetical protein